MNLAKFLNDKKVEAGLVSVIETIAACAEEIAHDVQRSAVLNLHGAAGGRNVHDDEVQKLDQHTNDKLKRALTGNSVVVGISSEEEESAIDVSDGKPGEYVVSYDPLDGSGNIDVNLPVGTIFSVLPFKNNLGKSLLQPAGKQSAAGYVLYSSSTVLVFSVGDGVHEFTHDPDNGGFWLTKEDRRIPENEGYINYNSSILPTMDAKLAKAYQELLTRSGLSMRWTGAMVADIHRTLLKGGFFAYPQVMKEDKFEGKLRFQYECKPLGWLLEQAGGKVMIDGQPLNDFQPVDLHQKVGIEAGDAGVMELFAELT